MNAIDLENKYGCFNYKPLPVVLVKGEGVFEKIRIDISKGGGELP